MNAISSRSRFDTGLQIALPDMDELTITSEPWEQAVVRKLATSKKPMVEMLRSEFGLVMSAVAKFTPPASLGKTGKSAEVQGKAKVAADIRSLYGTPSDAFEALGGRANLAAKAFWSDVSHGRTADAAQIVKKNLGKSFAPFDGGILHSRTAGGRKRRRTREVIYYVTDKAALDAYIQEVQGHVWYLASGWEQALKALNRPLTYGIGKIDAPGSFKIIITSTGITLTAIDKVRFASQVSGIENRIRWAMNEFRVPRMQRQWDYYIKTIK